MIAQDIVIRPIITEKSMSGVLNKVYTFEVAKSANKIEIAKACEELFKVEVAKVNTVSVRGKFRRQGRNNGGYSKSWKKAIITLKENSKPIDFSFIWRTKTTTCYCLYNGNEYTYHHS